MEAEAERVEKELRQKVRWGRTSRGKHPCDWRGMTRRRHAEAAAKLLLLLTSPRDVLGICCGPPTPFSVRRYGLLLHGRTVLNGDDESDCEGTAGLGGGTGPVGRTAAVQAVEECVRGVQTRCRDPRGSFPSRWLARDGSARGLERIWLGDEEGRGPGGEYEKGPED